MHKYACGLFMSKRLVAGGVHFALSCFFAILIAFLVFFYWYPYPYSEISGGKELFTIVMGVDVILGPVITIIVFNEKKIKKEIKRDLICVGVLQLIALLYGLWTVAIARPVHLVFEFDRFRIVHAVDIPEKLISMTPAGIVAMPYTGPTLVGVREFKNPQEEMEATLMALQGVSLSFRPDLWQTYDASRADVLKKARSVDELKKRFPKDINQIVSVLVKENHGSGTASYLPMTGRNYFWTVIIDSSSGDVLGFLPLDSF